MRCLYALDAILWPARAVPVAGVIPASVSLCFVAVWQRSCPTDSQPFESAMLLLDRGERIDLSAGVALGGCLEPLVSSLSRDWVFFAVHVFETPGVLDA